ncbi:beta-lactamase/transpeptidase-like protein [Mycena leptocephala]|nr:beta-lactamase/transpeptidase-like protein [Mycena leptocephala]
MRSFLLGIGLFFCFDILASAADNSTQHSTTTQILNAEVDSFINNILAEWNSPGGVAVAVVRMDGQGGWLVETKGYGVAKADGTKLFTVLATGLLISNESLSPPLSWKTRLASVIPDWKFIDSVASAESTITDIMSHRTGLPSHDFGLFLFNDTFRSIIERIQYLKPSLGFREGTQYNNFMYVVLSYLPTVLLPNKPPFGRYVKEHILDPLGMNSSTYSFTVANGTGRMADGFAREKINTTENPLGPGTTRVLPFFFPNSTEDGDTTAGDGGILSTATDMARWLQMLLLEGQHPTTNATIIPTTAFQQAATGVSAWEGNDDFGQLPGAPELSPALYSGGQAQSSYRGHVQFEHEGALLGFHSRVTRYPFDGVGVAIMTNDDAFGPLLKEIIKFRIADEAFKLEPVDWNSRYKTAAQEIELATTESTSTLSPPNATLPFPLTAVQNTIYRNLGYGADIELCGTATGTAQSVHCKALLVHLSTAYPEQIAAADLVWAWDRYLASYVALSHFEGPVFNVSGWIQMPTGNASAPFWAYNSVGGVAEFAVDAGKVAGFGMRGGVWGAADFVDDPQGQTVEERSEAATEVLVRLKALNLFITKHYSSRWSGAAIDAAKKAIFQASALNHGYAECSLRTDRAATDAAE